MARSRWSRRRWRGGGRRGRAVGRTERVDGGNDARHPHRAGRPLSALPPGLPLSIELRSKSLCDKYPDPKARAIVVAEVTRRWLANVQ